MPDRRPRVKAGIEPQAPTQVGAQVILGPQQNTGTRC